MDLLNSRALTKVQAVILIVIIVIVLMAGGLTYFLSSRQKESSDTIKIGLIGDLDTQEGEAGWQAAILAIEEINAKGGVLGRVLELIVEDDESMSVGGDPTKSTLALTRLITIEKVDLVVSMVVGSAALMCQDVSAEHKIIYLNAFAALDVLTQRVFEDYNRYKYFFSTVPNSTALTPMSIDIILHLRDITGFNKIAYLSDYYPAWDDIKAGLDDLPETHGFELVYGGEFPPGTVDFSSYFSAIEAAGAEALITMIASQDGISFVKEWYDRQSPVVIWELGPVSANDVFWELTDRKSDYISAPTSATVSGYPLTSKTLSTRNSYFERWNQNITQGVGGVYNTIRFVLVDALQRAGTTETEAVVSALEGTSVETSDVENLVFTSSHSILVGENPNDPENNYYLMLMFQWQNGELIPVYPQKIMEKAGVSYTFPPWDGPWNK